MLNPSQLAPEIAPPYPSMPAHDSSQFIHPPDNFAAELDNSSELTIKDQEILDTMAHLFAQMTNLHTLHLENIHRLPENIGDLPNLKELTVARVTIVKAESVASPERVKSLPESFSNLKNSLEKLSLINTRVSELPPRQLQGFMKLHTLEMPRNPLQRRTARLNTKTLATLRNLKVLDLSNTGIKQTACEKNLSEIPIFQSNPQLVQHILKQIPSMDEGKERGELVKKFRELLGVEAIPEIQIQELVRRGFLEGQILYLPKEQILAVVRQTEELNTKFGDSLPEIFSYITTAPLQQKQAEALFKQIPELLNKIAKQLEEYPEIEDEIITAAKKIPTLVQYIPELSQKRELILEKLERLILDETCIHYLPRTFEEIPHLKAISLVRSPRYLDPNHDSRLATLCKKGITILMGDPSKYKVLVSENSPLLTTDNTLATVNALFPHAQIQKEPEYQIIQCPKP